MMSEELVTVCFQIITYVGTARSCFVNAVQCAKDGKFDEAESQLKQGDEAFVEGHRCHADLIAREASGELQASGLEDQMMSAESFRIIAEEFIAVYKRLSEGA